MVQFFFSFNFLLKLAVQLNYGTEYEEVNIDGTIQD